MTSAFEYADRDSSPMPTECEVCGAAMSNRQLHGAWHSRLLESVTPVAIISAMQEDDPDNPTIGSKLGPL